MIVEKQVKFEKREADEIRSFLLPLVRLGDTPPDEARIVSHAAGEGWMTKDQVIRLIEVHATVGGACIDQSDAAWWKERTTPQALVNAGLADDKKAEGPGLVMDVDRLSSDMAELRTQQARFLGYLTQLFAEALAKVGP